MPKKKKAAANPARGFATTSVASKSKSVVVSVEAPSPPSSNNTPSKSEPAKGQSETFTSASSQSQVKAQQPQEPARNLHELTPEELEERLEDADVQNFITKQSAKIQKTSARHVKDLQTDCRILRGQAQPLQCRYALPECRLSQLLHLAAEDVQAGKASVATASTQSQVQGDDLVTNLWSLERTLRALGLTDSQVEGALRHVLRHPPVSDLDAPIWALDDCLEWLAVSTAEKDLPVFDAQSGRTVDLATELESGEDLTLPQEPIRQEQHQDGKKNGEAMKDRNGDAPPTPDSDESDVSALEDDLEPEELQSKYLATKSRFFEKAPDLIEAPSGKKRKGRQQTLANNHALRPAVRRLQQKLDKIERDMLFDKARADEQWENQRILLVREQAERRKLRVDRPETLKSTSDSGQSSEQQKQGEDQSSGKEEGDDASDDGQALSDLFGAMPHDEKPAPTSTPATSNSTLLNISIRDFGEESVKKGADVVYTTLINFLRARDSGATYSHRLIFDTAFSNRHSFLIKFSKPQYWDTCLESHDVKSVMRPRGCLFTMEQTATPSSAQSLSYVSTFALFQLTTALGGTDKAWLKMPTAWKELFGELTEAYKLQQENAEKNTVKWLRSLVESKPGMESDDDVVLTRNFKKRLDGSVSRPQSSSDLDGTAAVDYRAIWQQKSATPAFKNMLSTRQNLPMWQFKQEALKTVEQNQVTIIRGETGCGKSTQMPSFLLEHEMSNGRPCMIYCTEPRRISAITLAQRVGQEIGEQKRDIGTLRSLVGYAIRLESQVSKSTRLVYATTGIVLRMLESRDAFRDITHILIDEVHERSIESDFLLTILRRLLPHRPDLKVILMSATVDAKKFSDYFSNAPVLNVPGRTFPVQRQFLEDAIELTGYTKDANDDEDVAEPNTDSEETLAGVTEKQAQFLSSYSSKTRTTLKKWNQYRIDYALILKLISSIIAHKDYAKYTQAFLVFLPGIGEIRKMHDYLSGTDIAKHYQIHMLHSSVASEDQQAAFEPPPRGFGKIVLSTNIAETGVTIPDCTCVIDTGTHKEMRFDERRQISRLIESFISRANAKQRCGRAGRVQEGLCFHLFTKERHDERMAEAQTPEMLRLSLQDLVMRVKICKLGDIQEFLAEALDPPSVKNVRRAIDALVEVDALTAKEELTDLGQQLSKLPLDPYLGKLALFGSVFGCLDVTLTLAALLSSKSPFVSSPGIRSQADLARTHYKKGDSDMLTEYNAYCAWRRVCNEGVTSEVQFCRRNCLSAQTLGSIEDIKAQLLTSLTDDTGLVTLSPEERRDLSRVQNTIPGRKRRFTPQPTDYNKHTNHTALVTAVIAWAFYPKLLVRDGKGWRNVGNSQSVSIHPTSVLKQSPPSNWDRVKFLSFYSILQAGGGRFNANSLTPVAPMALVIMAGNASFHPTAHVVVIDGARLKFAIDTPVPKRRKRVDGEEQDKDEDVNAVIGPWKTWVTLKLLRRRLDEIVQWHWKRPGKPLPTVLRRWYDAWGELCADWEKKDNERA